MTTENSMIEQHAREFESHLRHIDELMERAQKGIEEGTAPEEARATLEQVGREREKLSSLYEELKLSSTENWRKEEIIKSGPMGLWDAVAQQLEKLVERFER